MGPLSRSDEVGYREYLRGRFMECFGPEDHVLTWSVHRLLDDLWALKFYGDYEFVAAIKRSSQLSMKFQLRGDETLERRLEEIKRPRGRNEPIKARDLWLRVARDRVESLNHSLEVIESYRPGLGQRLSQAAKELLTEPLEKDDKAASGGIAGAA
jgi:hypothetical protein